MSPSPPPETDAPSAQALLGKGFSVLRQRGEVLKSAVAPRVMATVHPSSLLRARGDEERHAQMARFVEDLKKAALAIQQCVQQCFLNLSIDGVTVDMNDSRWKEWSFRQEYRRATANRATAKPMPGAVLCRWDCFPGG